MWLIDNITSFFRSEDKPTKTGTDSLQQHPITADSARGIRSADRPTAEGISPQLEAETTSQHHTENHANTQGPVSPKLAPDFERPSSVTCPTLVEAELKSDKRVVGKHGLRPQSEEEARGHILRIRENKAQIKNGELVERSLNLLSDQLYHNSTHFLLEMIQNVDDTSYEESEPTLSIYYENRTLRLDSNQKGFTMNDVDAICDMGNSTKNSSLEGFKPIGHKGIGFKSVFKVADVVWIRSGFYSFKFVKSSQLGRISPVWDTSRNASSDGLTSFYLELSQNCDVTELIEGLKRLNSITLVFLRRLRKIDIEVLDKHGNYKVTLLRPEAEPKPSGLRSLDLPHDMCSYTFSSHSVSLPPPDGKGTDREQSDVMLGFPHNPTPGSSGRTYDVYAFLPIRDYGFKFILQADFQLVTNREDIDKSSTRNKDLISEIPVAFLRAVEKMNTEKHPLRHSWPHYLPQVQQRDDFFKDLSQNMLQQLSGQPVLESLDGDLVVPSQLTFAPSKYTDEKGNPLVLPVDSTLIYASPKYSKMENELDQLGVRRLSDETFLNELEKFVPHSNFRSMPKNWHSRLSRVLDRLVERRRNRISGLELLPLRDGRWVAPNSGLLLFPFKSNNLTIPKAIGVFEVDFHVEGDPDRRRLAYNLGVEEPSKEKVWESILSTHRHQEFQPNNVSTADLISHMLFLYQTDWKCRSTEPGMWAAAESGERCSSIHMYLDSDDLFSARKMFAGHVPNVQFLHQDYTKAFESAPPMPVDWTSWIVDNFGISTIPRLVDPECSSELSTDFCVLAERPESSKVALQILRQHWKHYSKWIVDDHQAEADDQPASRITAQFAKQELRAKLSSMRVMCSDGSAHELKETYLPRDSILCGLNAASPNALPGQPSGERGLCFLSIPEPEDKRWNFLEHLGVVVQLKPSVFVEQLQQLRNVQTTKEQVSNLYEHLYACIKDVDRQFVRERFNRDKLIFIPRERAEGGNFWTDTSGCVWNGPEYLKRVPLIKAHYGKHDGLFLTVLGLPQARLGALVDEAAQIQSTDSLKYIGEVFKGMADHMPISTASELTSALSKILSLKMFPIWTPGKVGSQFTLENAGSRTKWYIADSPHLLESFQDKLPLLAFSPHVVSELKKLIDDLALGKRMLSALARRESKVFGKSTLEPEYSMFLRDRARYIARLAPTNSPDRDVMLSSLSHIHVLRTDNIEASWNIKDASVRGPKEPGVAALTSRPGRLDVSLISTDCEIGRPPPELPEEFARFCNIHDVEKVSLLTSILTETNHDRIEASLLRRRIPDEIPTWDRLVAQNKLRCSDCNSGPVFQDKSLRPTSSGPREKSDEHGESNVDSMSRDTCKFDESPGITLPTVHACINEAQAGTESHAVRPTPSPSRAGEDPSTDGETPLTLDATKSPKRESKPLSQPADHYSAPAELPVPVIFDQSSPSESNDHESIEGKNASSRGRTAIRKGPSGLRPPEPRDKSHSTVILPREDQNSDPGPRQSSSSGFVNFRSGLMYLPEPMTIFTGEDTDDTKYFGEVHVSQLLQNYLGRPFYDPKKHWTSHLRVRNGHPAIAPDSDSSTFTITEEADGKLAELLVERGVVSYGDLKFPCTFHIEVCTTNGDISSFFLLSGSQFEKCKALSLEKNKKASNVYVLARVYNVNTDAGIALYADPFRLQHILNFKSTSGYLGSVPGSLETFLAQESVSSAWNVDAHKIYQNLEVGQSQIRLLKLHPGAHDEPLHGSISRTDVDSPGEFWAISYVWGNKGGGFTFQTEQGSISITESLSTCLATLRHEKVEVPLWADAVCIDQNNNIEKSMQVRRMGSLYMKAARVIVWMGLGDREDGTCSAIEALKALHGSSCQLCEQHKIGESSLSEQASGLYSEGNPPKKDPIPDLLRRSWFTRTWIVQELVLGSDVLIKSGRSEIKWECFTASLIRYEEQMRHGPDPSFNDQLVLPNSSAVIALKRTREMYKQSVEMEFLKLLEIFAYARASKPCDKLFALLNLASDWPQGNIPTHFSPDYDSSEKQVLARYAEGFVQPNFMKVLDLLYRAGSDKSCRFCSWIPDFMDEKKAMRYPTTISTWSVAGNGSRMGDSFHAGKRTPPTARFVGQVRRETDNEPYSAPVVAIKGYMVDVVDDCWAVRMGLTDEYITFADAWEDIRSYTSVLTAYPKGSAQKTWKDDLTFKLLIGDARGPHMTSPLDFSLLQHRHHHHQQEQQEPQSWPPGFKQEILKLELGQNARKFADMPQRDQMRLRQYWQTAKAFTSRIPRATYCATKKKGYVGIVPGAALAGDEIFIANGAAVPLVVRKQGTDYHTLIGECYIHGLMYYSDSVVAGIDEQEVFLV